MTTIADSISFAAQPTGHDAARVAAAQDAAHLAATDALQALHATPSVNLSGITQPEAKIFASEEHKALGYRPPPGSLAAQAQSATAHHAQEDPEGASERGTQRIGALKEAARVDAAQIAERGGAVGAIPTVGLDEITKEGAARLQSEEHEILGHRPPYGSLAAQAQSAADRNLEGQNRINGQGPGAVDLNTISQGDANRPMSKEHKRLGHRPPADSLAAHAQAAASARSD